MAIDDHRDELTARLGAVGEPTPYEVDMAKRRVAERAVDADECLELMRMLGLVDPGFEWVSRIGSSQDKRRKVITGGGA